MTLVMPNVGEAKALDALTGKTAAATPWTLDLFSNNRTPANTDVAADYTASVGGGYAQKSLTAATWGAAVGGSPTTATYGTAQTFTFTGATDAPGTVYGYYIRDSAGILILAERLASPPFTPASNGDSVTVTPKITLASSSGD